MIQKVEKALNEGMSKESVEEASKMELPSARSLPVVVFGVAAAAGLGILAASLIGVGEVAIAGAAGYLAYRRMTEGMTEGTPEESKVEPRVEGKSRRRLRSV